MLLPILLIVVLGGMFFFRTRQQNKARQEQKSKLAPGSHVMTNFGLFGTVVDINQAENKVTIEMSPGNQATLHAQAIGRVIDTPTPAAQPTENPNEPHFTVPDDASSLTDGTKPNQPSNPTTPSNPTQETSQAGNGSSAKPQGPATPQSGNSETPEETIARLRREANGNSGQDK